MYQTNKNWEQDQAINSPIDILTRAENLLIMSQHRY